MSETIQDKEAQPLTIKKPKKLGENIPGKEYKVDLNKKQEDAIGIVFYRARRSL